MKKTITIHQRVSIQYTDKTALAEAIKALKSNANWWATFSSLGYSMKKLKRIKITN